MTLQRLIRNNYGSGTQLSIGQVYAIGSAIRAEAPEANVLIFGCGNDSDLWSRINFDGHTLFLEHDPVWIDRIAQQSPDLNIVDVSYGDRTLENSLPLDEEALASFSPPACLLDREWAVIIIDGPPGHKASHPGRSLPIYWSSLIARAETQIFVDDYNRKLERVYSDHFFLSKRPWSVVVPRIVRDGKPTASSLLWVFGVDAAAQAAAMRAQFDKLGVTPA